MYKIIFYTPSNFAKKNCLDVHDILIYRLITGSFSLWVIYFLFSMCYKSIVNLFILYLGQQSGGNLNNVCWFCSAIDEIVPTSRIPNKYINPLSNFKYRIF